MTYASPRLAKTTSKDGMSVEAGLAVKPTFETMPERTGALAGQWLAFLGGHGIHPKLEVSDPDDADEREADAVADRIMRMAATPGGPLPISATSCPPDEGDRRIARKKRGGVDDGQRAAETAADAVASGGRPLEATERSFFEPRFGRDLSDVRIHTGPRADGAATGIGALAYTSGQHIAFAAGQYRPDNQAGLRLLAHELAHTAQRRAGGAGSRIRRRSLWQQFAGLFSSDSFSDVELKNYLLQITRQGQIEDFTDSDNKARAVVSRLRNGKDLLGVADTAELRSLLIREMQSGSTGDDDEQAILYLLDTASFSALNAMFNGGGLSVGSLESDFHGSELQQLRRLLDRRFRGGRKALTRGVVQADDSPFVNALAWLSAAGAAAAMRAYEAMPLADRRLAVADSYERELRRVLNALSAVDKTKTFVDSLREIGRFVEEIETQKSSGMTDDQMAAEQAKFIMQEAKAAADANAAAAAAAAKTPVIPPTPAEIEAERKKSVAAKSSVAPAVVGWWAGLSPAEKTTWTNRGNAAIAAIVALANTKNPELGITAANFNLDFEKVEKRGSNVIAAGSPALVGKRFVETAELNPAYVMDIVVHEVFGHPEYGKYGDEYHMKLYDQAAAKVPGYVQPAAGTPERTQELDTYAYQETEIYAVLRSMAFRTAPSAADAGKVPNLDTQTKVNAHVAAMKKQWAPNLIVSIMRGLLKRLIIDPRIEGPAIKVFHNAVNAAFDAKMAAAILK